MPKMFIIDLLLFKFKQRCPKMNTLSVLAIFTDDGQLSELYLLRYHSASCSLRGYSRQTNSGAGTARIYPRQGKIQEYSVYS